MVVPAGEQFVLRPCLPTCLVGLASQVTVPSELVLNVWFLCLGTVLYSPMEP